MYENYLFDEYRLLFLNEAYSAVILDIMLPKIDGIEVLKKVRKENISTPIILLTAKNQIDDKILETETNPLIRQKAYEANIKGGDLYEG